MKKKTYYYENRTFEVIVSDEYRGGDGLQKSGYKKSFALTASSLVALNFSIIKPLTLTSMTLLMKLCGLLLLTVWRKKRMARLLMKNGRAGMKKLIKIAY